MYAAKEQHEFSMRVLSNSMQFVCSDICGCFATYGNLGRGGALSARIGKRRLEEIFRYLTSHYRSSFYEVFARAAVAGRLGRKQRRANVM